MLFFYHSTFLQFQEGLGVPLLYELVADEVKEIQEYYEERSSRRINSTLNFLTFFFLPLSTLATVFAMPFVKGTWLYFGITLGIVFLLSFTIWFLLRWRK